MELDDLKDIWKKSGPEFRAKGKAELALMLQGRSTSIVDKLKRNVWIELLATFAGSLFMLVYALDLPSGTWKWTSVSFIIVFSVYSIYYIKKLLLLSRFNPADENLKNHIDRLIISLSSFLKFYKRSYNILYPVFFVLVLIFIAIERGATDFIDAMTRPAMIASLVFLSGFYYFLSTSFTTWYLKKLYGNHLDKLKSLAHELED